MAVRSLGQLTLDLVARTGGFVKGMDQAQRRSAKWRKQVSSDLKAVGTGFKLAAAAAAAGFGAMVIQTTNSAREIRNLAQISDTSTQSFQRAAYGASRYGIQQDKLSDILKDTNDRIGDFIQTGGGPMADFFENIAPKVGVTAEQFAKLSGPEALQLFYDSLEKANLSQKDMTFYMEAIASDATALIPLLANGGEEMNRLGDEAERTGNVFDEMEFEQLEQIKQGIDELTGAATGMKNEIVLAALPAIEDLVALLSSPQTLENAKALGNAIVTAMSAAVRAIDTVIGVTGFLAEEVAAFVHGPGLHDIVRLEMAVEEQEALLDRLMNGPNRPPKSVIDEEIEKLEMLQHRLKQGIELQQTLLGAGTSSSPQGDGDDTAGGDSAVYNLVPTKAQQAAAESVKDLGEEADDGAKAIKTFSDQAVTSTRAMASAAAGFGRGALGTIAGMTPGETIAGTTRSTGMLSVRQSIEAGKDLTPYWLENDDTARPTWSTGMYDAATSDMVRSVGGGKEIGPHIGTVTLAKEGGGKIDVQANADELRSFVATLFANTASSV